MPELRHIWIAGDDPVDDPINSLGTAFVPRPALFGCRFVRVARDGGIAVRLIGTLSRVHIDIQNAGNETLDESEPIRKPRPIRPPRGFLGVAIDFPAGSGILR